MSGSDHLNALRTLLSKSLKSLDLETKVNEQAYILAWEEIVGEPVASSAQPEFVRDGKMFIVTKSSVWSNELNMRKKDIIFRLNRHIGSSLLKDMVFRVGRIKREKSAKKPKEIDLEGIQLTDEELLKVEEAITTAGPEMSESLRKVMTTSIRLEKWRKTQGWVPCKACGVLQKEMSGLCPVCQLQASTEHEIE